MVPLDQLLGVLNQAALRGLSSVSSPCKVEISTSQLDFTPESYRALKRASKKRSGSSTGFLMRKISRDNRKGEMHTKPHADASALLTETEVGLKEQEKVGLVGR